MSELTPVPLLDLKAQYKTIKTEIDAAIQRVVESQYFILGPEVRALETEIAEYSQCEFAIGVSSGTDALLAALMALEIGPGDEVITTSFSFFATAGAVARLGARPVFVDIEPGTYNMDVAGIERAVTDRTRVILPVQLFGQMPDMDPILEIACDRNLFVIEDAAQAIGSEYRGRRAGSLGDIGCFSFYPSKNLGAFGDAGMIVTQNEKLAERLRLLRAHGASPKYYHDLVGGNFRLDAIQAAVLRVKFKYLDQWTAARQQNAGTYRRLFKKCGLTEDQVRMPLDAGYGRHIYNQFVIAVDDRDGLLNYLISRQIGCEVYYPVPLHLQACFQELGYREGDFPVSEAAARHSLALPVYPELSELQQSVVVESIKKFIQS